MKLSIAPFVGFSYALTILPLAPPSNVAVQKSLAAIETIHSNVKILIADLDNYHGGLAELIPSTLQVTKVDLATKNAADANMQLPDPLSDADTQTLIATINSTLAVVNPEAVAKLKTKKKYTQPLGVDPVIKGFLTMLLDDHLRFSNAILERVPKRDVAETNVPMDIISNALQDGVSFFRN